MDKTFKELECPCCGAKLFYDPVHGDLLTHAPGMTPGKDLSLNAAVSALQVEKEKADEKFRAAFEKEGRRKESLKKKFDEGLRDTDRSPEPPTLRDIDLD